MQRRIWKGGFGVVTFALGVGLRARLWTLKVILRSHLVAPPLGDDYVKNTEKPPIQIRRTVNFIMLLSRNSNDPPLMLAPSQSGGGCAVRLGRNYRFAHIYNYFLNTS